MNITILGAGNVGKTLGTHWSQVGHRVTYAVRKPEDSKHKGLSVKGLEGAAQDAEVMVLAVPFSAAQETLAVVGDLAGKILIDATNPVSEDFSGLSIGLTTSAGEQVAAWAPTAKVVKAFNSIGFNVMDRPVFHGVHATLLIAGDDPAAKATVFELAVELGFDPEDAGPIVQSRSLEAFAWLWISLAMKYGHGRDIAFRLMKR